MTPPPVRAISDQFAHDKGVISKALMKLGRGIELVQRHKAESDLAVAAASSVPGLSAPSPGLAPHAESVSAVMATIGDLFMGPRMVARGLSKGGARALSCGRSDDHGASSAPG